MSKYELIENMNKILSWYKCTMITVTTSHLPTLMTFASLDFVINKKKFIYFFFIKLALLIRIEYSKLPLTISWIERKRKKEKGKEIIKTSPLIITLMAEGIYIMHSWIQCILQSFAKDFSSFPTWPMENSPTLNWKVFF